MMVRMVEAIEHSELMVICVSEKYKQSSNCRMEAQYTNTRVKRGLLNLMFVMMNDHYTTASNPKYCDGWLGIMIGKLWLLLVSIASNLNGSTIR